MSIVVFAGPSIHGLDIPVAAGLMICPPAAQGDIFRASLSKPSAIGLIDGYFDSVPSIWHKEILWSISKGIAVFGSASMGALRAAELDSFGMVGIGRIYRWYSEGTLEDDDEVALLHGPAETRYLPLSEPMVNIRATCDAAVLAGVLKQSTADAIVTSAKNIHYRDRTWDHVLASVQEKNLVTSDLAQFANWKIEGYVDQKRRDAAELLSTILKPLPETRTGSLSGFQFEWTNLWDKAMQEWLADVTHSSAHTATSADAVLDELRLDPGLFHEICTEAVTRSILLAEADRRQLAVDMTEKRTALSKLRANLGLSRKADLDAWAARNLLTETSLETMIDEEARKQALLHMPFSALGRHIIAILQSRDQYNQLATRAAKKRSALLEAKSRLAFEAGELTPPQLLNWFFGNLHKQSAPNDIDSFLQDLRLESRQDFYRLLADEYVYIMSNKGLASKEG
jgi:hypothetical protein